MAHHHFTRDDRVLLVKLKASGLSNRSCARILRFHPSTIGRELKRGAADTAIGYSIRVADDTKLHNGLDLKLANNYIATCNRSNNAKSAS